MFKYLIKFNNEPLYLLKSWDEVAKLFEFWDEEYRVNGLELCGQELGDSVEIIRGEWTKHDAAELFGELYLECEHMMLCNLEHGTSCDAYLIWE